MKNRRDIIIITGLFVVLILFVTFGPASQTEVSDPNRPTTRSSANRGALALYTWTREMGFDARRLEYRPFELFDTDAALVVLNPIEPFTREQAQDTLDWVERGGVLLFADDSLGLFGGANPLLEELDVEREVFAGAQTLETAQAAQPAFDQPPLETAVVRTGYVLNPRRTDFATLLASDGATVMIGISYGSGYIYLSAATHPFTNQGLTDSGNAELMLNILRRVPPGGRIQFDEYHQGFFDPPTTTSIVFSTPWGWAAAYAVIAIALYLVLSGRRFGRPIPLKEEVTLRSSAEYVESMADLFQRGGKRGYILNHYHTAFKRRLARTAGINPRLEDADFVRELSRFREVDEPALLALLARLRNERADESALVRAVNEAEEMLRSMGQR